MASCSATLKFGEFNVASSNYLASPPATPIIRRAVVGFQSAEFRSTSDTGESYSLFTMQPGASTSSARGTVAAESARIPEPPDNCQPGETADDHRLCRLHHQLSERTPAGRPEQLREITVSPLPAPHHTTLRKRYHQRDRLQHHRHMARPPGQSHHRRNLRHQSRNRLLSCAGTGSMASATPSTCRSSATATAALASSAATYFSSCSPVAGPAGSGTHRNAGNANHPTAGYCHTFTAPASGSKCTRPGSAWTAMLKYTNPAASAPARSSGTPRTTDGAKGAKPSPKYANPCSSDLKIRRRRHRAHSAGRPNGSNTTAPDSTGRIISLVKPATGAGFCAPATPGNPASVGSYLLLRETGRTKHNTTSKGPCP